jgi:quinol monooxygenase YgiN
VLVGFERWASEADHQRHLRASHIGQLMARFDGILVAEPVIASYSVIDE